MFAIPILVFLVSLFSFILGVIPSKIKLSQKKEDFIFIICGAIFLSYTIGLCFHAIKSEHSLPNLGLIALGCTIMFILNRLVLKKQPCCSNGFITTEWGLLSLASISLCSINDGIILYFSNSSVFSLFIIGFIFHKFITSFLIARIIYTCQVHHNLQKLLGVLILLATPIAYFVTHLIVNRPHTHEHETHLGEYTLAFSTGVLLYVTISGIYPRIHRYFKTQKLQLLFAATIFIVTFFAGSLHSH